MDHTRQLWKSYDNMREAFGDPTQLGEPRWDGVHSNAGMSPMFGAADELFRDMYSTYSLNHLIDPIDIGPEGFALQTAKTLATFGIFNPVGPSVGSIEVAINYRLGAALLLERLRHPHAPTTRIHAVLDQNGFNSIERLLADLVARLEWSTFDWWDTRTSLPGDVAAMRRGLRRFAEKFPASDMERLTLGLMEAVDDPWVRVAHDFRPRIQTPKGVDPIDFWIDAISDRTNIDTHIAFIRSSWEGATAWVAAGSSLDDETTTNAQVAADRVRRSVWCRREGRQQ